MPIFAACLLAAVYFAVAIAVYRFDARRKGKRPSYWGFRTWTGPLALLITGIGLPTGILAALMITGGRRHLLDLWHDPVMLTILVLITLWIPMWQYRLGKKIEALDQRDRERRASAEMH